MSAKSATRPAAGFLLRHYIEMLTALTVLFVLQNGLVPFDFGSTGIGPHTRVFFTTTVSHLTFPDTVANIFLYVPIGVLLHWTLSRGGRCRTTALPLAVAIAAALSATVEWLQAYSPARVSSVIDLTANVIGAAVGASVAWVGRGTFPRLVEAAVHEIRERPQAALLKAYCFVLVLCAAVPLSFSFDTIRLKKAVKSANFVPFRAGVPDDVLAGNVPGEADQLARAHLEWQRMKRWSRWAAECASFAVLAWLLQWVLQGDYGFNRRATVALACWMGGGMAVGLSVLQLLIVSRACDVTDVLFRLFGLCVGLIVSMVYLHAGDPRSRAPHDRQWQRLTNAGWVAALAYIVYTGVIPLTFDAAGPSTSLASKNFLPFFAYFMARFDVMIDDVMEKFAAYAVFSALLASHWSHTTRRGAHSPAWRVVAAGVSVSALIETVQMFIPVRVTSLTDPILAATGCLVGVLAQQHAVAFYRFARSVAVGPEHARAVPGRLGPSDALVATLTDPHPDAPAERPPAHKRKTPR